MQVLLDSLLSKYEVDSFLSFLHNNMDVFSWQHLDMVGVDPIVAVH